MADSCEDGAYRGYSAAENSARQSTTGALPKFCRICDWSSKKILCGRAVEVGSADIVELEDLVAGFCQNSADRFIEGFLERLEHNQLRAIFSQQSSGACEHFVLVALHIDLE